LAVRLQEWEEYLGCRVGWVVVCLDYRGWVVHKDRPELEGLQEM
jgi:hypothetical protein